MSQWLDESGPFPGPRIGIDVARERPVQQCRRVGHQRRRALCPIGEACDDDPMMTGAGHRSAGGLTSNDVPNPDLLYRSIVEGVGDLIVAFDEVGTIVFANQAARAILGFEPEDLQGRNVLDFIYAPDHDRALRALGMNQNFGAAPGLTAFRLVHANGHPVLVDMTGGHATDDGERVLYTSSSRVNENREAMQTTLLNLLEGAPLHVALRPVCDIFTWQGNGSQVGVSWRDGAGVRASVSTGIDLDLVGDHDDEDSPWAEVRRSGEPIVDLDLSRLDPARRGVVEALGLVAYWIEPVANPSGEPALVTVFTATGRRPPAGHELGMSIARSVVAVILRWSEQQRLLDLAASSDALTALANRKAFFDAVEANRSAGGAVLYLDLDRFKPVNDRFGHGAGDDLLKEVAARLTGCIRRGDVVARLGGDEFAILCPRMSPEAASSLVARIEAAIAEPFDLSGNEVRVGISIGVAHDAESISDELVERADRELYVHKLAR